MISKAEFDSQRASEEQEPEGDGDLVFGPLDQEDVAPPTTTPAAVTTNTTTAANNITTAPAPKPEQRASEQEAGHRGRGQDREGRGRSPSSKSPHTQRRRRDRHARFYPVLNKRNCPSQVRQLSRLGLLVHACTCEVVPT